MHENYAINHSGIGEREKIIMIKSILVLTFLIYANQVIDPK